MDKEAKKDKIKFSARVSDFLRKYRKAVLGVFIIVIAFVVGLGAYSIINQSVAQKAAAAYESLEKNYQSWLDETVDAAKQTKAAEVIAEADKISSQFRSTYSADQAIVIKAKVLFEKKDYKAASEAYLSLVSTHPDSHMAPMALMNAAAIVEESGDKQAALALLQRLETEYAAKAVGIDRALFNIGRIYEELAQYDNAFGAYTKLVAKGVNDDWTKLAHDRIIYLKANSLIK